MASSKHFQLRMLLHWFQLLGFMNSTLAESFNISRRPRSRTSATEDVVTIPHRSCVATSQLNKCAMYGANTVSTTSPCQCDCRGNKRTFAFSGQRWGCSSNSDIRQREGCNIQFEGYDDRDGMRILEPKASVSMMLSWAYCRIDRAASRYMLCDGTWATLTVFTDQQTKFSLQWTRNRPGVNLHGYTLMVDEARVLQHLNGRMIKLSLSCPFARPQCVLFKLEGFITCPVSLEQPVDTLATDFVPTQPLHPVNEKKTTVAAIEEVANLPAETPTTQAKTTTTITAGPKANNESHHTENLDNTPSIKSPKDGRERRSDKFPSTVYAIAIAIGGAVVAILLLGILLMWLRRRKKNRNASANLPAPPESANSEGHENDNAVAMSSTDYEDVFSLGTLAVRPDQESIVNRSYRKDSDDVILIGCGPLVEEPCYEDIEEEGLYRITELTHGKPSTSVSLPSKQPLCSRYQSLMNRVAYTARYAVPERNAQKKENTGTYLERAVHEQPESASSCSKTADGESSVKNEHKLAAKQFCKETRQCTSENDASLDDRLAHLPGTSDKTAAARDNTHLYHDLEEMDFHQLASTEVASANELRLEDLSVTPGQVKIQLQKIEHTDDSKTKKTKPRRSAPFVSNKNDLGLPKKCAGSTAATNSADSSVASPAGTYTGEESNNGTSDNLKEGGLSSSERVPEEPYLELFQYKPTEYIEELTHNLGARKNVQNSKESGETSDSRSAIQDVQSETENLQPLSETESSKL